MARGNSMGEGRPPTRSHYGDSAEFDAACRQWAAGRFHDGFSDDELREHLRWLQAGAPNGSHLDPDCAMCAEIIARADAETEADALL